MNLLRPVTGLIESDLVLLEAIQDAMVHLLLLVGILLSALLWRLLDLFGGLGLLRLALCRCSSLLRSLFVLLVLVLAPTFISLGTLRRISDSR